MKTFSLSLALLALASYTSAAPSKHLQPRNPSQCDPFSSISTGAYTIRSNEWGADPSEGSQCSSINNLDGNTLSWSTSWNWKNNTNQVKSFTNVQSSSVSCKPLNQYQSIPTAWSWSYTGDNLRANVAYDTFLSISCGSNQQSYEVMIWLADFGGVSPLSDSGYPPIGPIPTATPTINGLTFNLILGTNGATKVFSFVAQQSAKGFDGDLMAFYRYLASHQGLDLSAQVLASVQAGSEVFTGSNANFVTSGYSIATS